MMERRSFPDISAESRVADAPETPLARRADFQLGLATVRPSLLRVDGPAGSIAIEPKAMQMLVAFADARGAVLTRDDLMERCWKGRTVGDDSVNRVIAELRRVARDAGAGFRIENIPRTGYRLVETEQPAADGQGMPEPVAAPPMEDLQRSVSRRWLLAGGAAALVAGGVATWTMRAPPVDPQTARMIADARLALQPGTPAMDGKAIALLEQAVARSPDDATAWGLLALARARTDEHAGPTSDVLPATEIEGAARRALDLDPDNADAKAALAIAIPYYGDWLGGEQRLDAVLAEHPDHVATRDARGFLLNAVGRIRDSADSRLGLAEDAPFDAGVQFRTIYSLWSIDRIAEADRVASRAMEMWPRHQGVWFGRLWLLAGTGRLDRALAHVDNAALRPALPPPMVKSLRAALLAAESRDPAAVAAAAAGIKARASQNVASVVNGLMLLNLMGAIDQAFEVARGYYLESGPVHAATQVGPSDPKVPDQRRRKTNMLFTPTAAAMQHDPRFMPLMQDMGLADYWARRGVRPDFLTV